MRISILSLTLTAGLLVAPMVAADFQRGYDAFNEGDYDTALAEFTELADQGDAWGQTMLGVMYDRGLGVEQDHVRAREFYLPAAEQGISTAQNNLAVLYADGLGTPQDFAEAIRWFRMSAKQGNDMAQYSLGQMYQHGDGVEQNNAMALDLYRQAAELGNEQASETLDSGFGADLAAAENAPETASVQEPLLTVEEATAAVRDGNYDAAFASYHARATQGNPAAQFGLGMMYEKGWGVARDISMAYMWSSIAFALSEHPDIEGYLDDLEDQMSENEVSLGSVMALQCILTEFQDCGP